MKSKLWIASELFFPDQTSSAFYITKIANELADKYEVHVVTATKEAESDVYIDPRIKVNRISSDFNKNSLLSRAIGFVYVSLSFFFFLLKRMKKKENLLIITNPAPFIILAAILTKIKKANLKILVHDVFPENTISAGIFKSKKSLGYRFLQTIFSKAYSTAQKIIVCGRDMQDIFQKKIKNVEVLVITNWAETDILAPQKCDWNDKIVFQFAGNMGRVQGLDKLMRILKKVKNPLLEFHFVGNGAYKEKIETLKEQFQLDFVKIYPPFQRENQIKVLNTCNIGLVTLSNGMYGLGAPSKSYNIMAVGKPIFYIGELKTEIREMILENKIGFVFTWEEKNKIINFLNNLSLADIGIFNEKGQKAREIAENYYSEDKILNQYKKHL